MSITSVVNDNIGDSSFINAQKPIPPTITNYAVSGSDDTALLPAGGQTVLINGTGFQRGATVSLSGTAIGVVTWVSANQLSFTSPASAAGTYTLFVINADGGTAIFVPGLVYSNNPTWVTSAGTLGSYYETQAISNTVVATDDAPGALTYTLFSGTLPSGSTLSSGGVISGTAPVDSGSTTYSFTIEATDSLLQSTTRAFSLTINTDVVTWVNPSNGATISIDGTAYSNVLVATDAAGYNIASYTANALPAGLALVGNTISGTPTTSGNTTTLLTATAATTNRSATNTITWVVSLNDVFFDYVTTLISANTPITSVFVDDASTNNFPVTIVGDTRPNNFSPYTPGYYSVNFAAKTDFISIPATTALTTFTSDFTFEAWIYPTDTTIVNWYIWDSRQSGATPNAMVFGLVALASPVTGQARLLYYNGTSYYGTGVVNYNSWTHISYVRSGTTMAFYVNGVAGGTATISGTQTGTATSNPVYIGTKDNGLAGYGTTGFISNMRIVNGTAVYTGNFTPATTPLTGIANTVLLACQSNSFIDNSSNRYTLTKSSTATISGFDPFVPTGTLPTSYFSNYFDGTGDYLTLPSNQTPFTMGTGDFTVEMWVNISSLAAARTLYDTMNSGDGTGTGRFAMQISTGGTIQIFTGAGSIFTSGGTVTVGSWNHIAYTKNSNSGRLYLNGIQVNSTYTDNNNYVVGTTSRPIIGANGFDGSTNPMFGYISNLRVVKGTALYTANFTPPTAPLTAITNTSLLTCQSSTFIDNSTNNFTVTAVGNTVPSTFAPYNVVGNSVQFDGTSSYLGLPDNSGTTASGVFSVETYVYSSVTGTNRVIYGQYTSAVTSGRWYLRINTDNTLSWLTSSGSNITTSATVSTSVWQHVCLTRDASNVFRIFLNGVLVGTATNAVALDTGGCKIGIYVGVANYFNGYMSNFRIVSTAIPTDYQTSSTTVGAVIFTPPTSPLTAISGTSLLTCQSSLFIDVSANKFPITVFGNTVISTLSPFSQATPAITPITVGSTYFDGTGDYLSAPANSAFQFTGDFTVEFWINFNTLASDRDLVGNYVSNAAPDWVILMNASTIHFYPSSGASYVQSGTIVINTWYHIAAVRSGTTCRLYLNGVSVGTPLTIAGTVGDSTRSIFIGARNGASVFFNGYMSNVRIVKGTAVYTSAFTPPTAPVTAITGTQLLTCQTNQPVNNNVFIDNSTNNLLITRNGNATQGAFSPYGENWSNYFDGTGDYLDIPAGNSALSLGTGDFTIEFWLYAMSTSSGALVDCRNPDTANAGFGIELLTPNKIRFSTSGLAYIDSATTISVSTWYHVALTRASNIFKLYINGTVDANTYTGSATQNFTNTNYRIGSGQNGAFTGYLSNVRIVKGTAVYTANFTPSTTPLLPIANTSLLTCKDPNIVDDSANRFTLTRNGDVSVQKFGPFAATTLPTPYYSGYFDGTGDYLSVGGTTGFNLASATNYTVEAWIYITGGTNSYRPIVGKDWSIGTTFPSFTFMISNANFLEFHMGSGGGGSTGYQSIVGTTVPAQNTWYHVAFVASGSTYYMFINGAVEKTGAITGTVGVGANLVNVGQVQNAYNFMGYLSNVRITKSALYTSAFTPSTSPLTTTSQGAIPNNVSLLTCQNNTFIDNSTNNFAITAVGNTIPSTFAPFNVTYSTLQGYTPAVFGGSSYFDGTGDYLSLAASSAFDITSGDFTVQCWVYNTGAGAERYLFSQRGSGSGWEWRINATNLMQFFFTGGSSLISTGAIPANVWTHLAVTRSGNTIRMFINGIQDSSTTFSNGSTAATIALYVGWSTAGGGLFLGYMSDASLVKGTAVFTASFVPQNSPVTAVRNTTLLVNGTSAGVYDSSMMNNYETVGDAKIDTTVVKFAGTESVRFDGNGDSLTYIGGPSINFGTGAFTIELWVNMANTGTFSSFLRPDGAGDFVTFGYDWSNTQLKLDSRNAVILNVTTTAVVANTWTHVAATRSGTSLRLFVNGTQVGATTTNSTNFALTTSPIQIGGSSFSAAHSVNGYISDFRITKGIARYTTNFTPPTSSFQDK